MHLCIPRLHMTKWYLPVTTTGHVTLLAGPIRAIPIYVYQPLGRPTYVDMATVTSCKLQATSV